MLNLTDKKVYGNPLRAVEREVRAITTFDVRAFVEDNSFWLLRDRALVFNGFLIIAELEERSGGPR